MSTGLGAWLFSTLNGNGGVSALVGARIYPLVMPQPVPVMPAIVYQIVNDSPIQSLHGPTLGLRQARVQIDAYGANYAASQALADAIEAALDATSSGGGQCTAVRQGRRDLYESDTKLFRVSLDFSVWSNPT